MSRNAPEIAAIERHRPLWLAVICFWLLQFSGFADWREPALQSSAPKAEVVIVENATATDAFQPRANVIREMVEQGMTNVTKTLTASNAWRSLVNTQDVIGIKVFTEPGPNSGTRLAVVSAVIEGLIAGGIAPERIIVWDKRLVDMRLAGYGKLPAQFGVRLAASSDAGWDEDTFYENSILGTLVWGDLEFGRKGDTIGRKSFVSKLLSREITRLINITPMMNHNQAGVAGTLYSLALGSVDNTRRFESDAERLATAVPEIYALPQLSDKVVLNIVDGLVCQYEGEERSLLHYSTSLNQLRFSKDPVALDALSIQELERQRELAKTPKLRPTLDLYANAELLELGVADVKKIRVVNVKQP